MPEVVILLLAACGTALATGLGAIPVFVLGSRAKALTPFLLGIASGVMGVAAVVGLLAPAVEEGSPAEVLVGLLVGIGFLVWARGRFSADAGFLGRTGPGARTSALVFLVLFVHSLPEGFAVGTAFASDRAGLSLFVILAIAIQNIPEGTSVAIPMQEAGFGRARQFWAAVATSAPQPVGALIAFFAVEEVSGLLPVSFAFAAGAMLALIVVEMLPRAYEGPARVAPSVGVAAGAALMLALSLVLGV
ncbi:MAG TPA: ZIP family metal transporter [Solirubrobacterales bacterium]|jgi:ZIP family zinc transporter|nr:ZIP family metal transporter [Solirubrobacterales bacterium]